MVKCKGLPFSATVEKIEALFEPLELAEKGVRLCTNDQGMPTGECFVVLATEEAQKAALERHRTIMGSRFVTVELAAADEFLKAFPAAPTPARMLDSINAKPPIQPICGRIALAPQVNTVPASGAASVRCL